LRLIERKKEKVKEKKIIIFKIKIKWELTVLLVRILNK
jgi:hypothetical protein